MLVRHKQSCLYWLNDFFCLKSCKSSYEELCKSSSVNHILSKSSYEKLLEKDVSFSIHCRHIQTLVMEMHKVKCGYTPKIFSDFFNQKVICHYSLRTHPAFRVPLTRILCQESGTISYLGPKIWDIFSASCKVAVSLKMCPTRMSL